MQKKVTNFQSLRRQISLLCLGCAVLLSACDGRVEGGDGLLTDPILAPEDVVIAELVQLPDDAISGSLVRFGCLLRSSDSGNVQYRWTVHDGIQLFQQFESSAVGDGQQFNHGYWIDWRATIGTVRVTVYAFRDESDASTDCRDGCIHLSEVDQDGNRQVAVTLSNKDRGDSWDTAELITTVQP